MDLKEDKPKTTWKHNDKPRNTRTSEEIKLGEDMKIVKDIFVTMADALVNVPSVELMDLSIKLVKQAKEGLQ